jgi:FMN phosphatase YigB (HAD superfamily)
MSKAIFCDGGGVLFSDSSIKRHIYSAVNKFVDISYEEFMEKYSKYKTKAQTLPGYDNDAALRDYLAEIGLSITYNEVKKKINKIEKFKPSPDVVETLSQLHSKGMKFIILTDATKTGEGLKPYLTQMQISEYVADIISSKDVGVSKPDARFFEYALNKHNLKKEEVFFVGHDLDELIGAHELGFEVYAVNHNEQLDFLDNKHKLGSFKDLISLI